MTVEFYSTGQIIRSNFIHNEQFHTKKAYPPKRIGPLCYVYPLNNACAAFQIMAIAKMRTITIPITSKEWFKTGENRVCHRKLDESKTC